MLGRKQMKFSDINKRAEDEWNELQQSKKPKIFIGAATCGRSAGALGVKQTFQDEFQKRGINANIIEVGCLGPCYAEPLVNIAKPDRPNIFYRNVTSKMAIELIEKIALQIAKEEAAHEKIVKRMIKRAGKNN